MDFLLDHHLRQIDILKLFHGGFNTGHGKLREPNDIMSYAALACIAIQSNQNDQHGGQSIVNFDYGMAEGVRKTFRKRYWLNLQRALELLDHCTMDEGKWKQVQKDLLSRGLSPALTMPASYLAAEAKALQRLFNLDLPEITKSQAFAAKHATAETEQACHQAWSHSSTISTPCSRVQVRRCHFPRSTTEWIPLQRPGWPSAACCWPLRRDWETARRRSFPSRFCGSKKASI